MSKAQQFIDQLREGNTTEAIKTIKESMYQNSAESIDETRQQVLESYGFIISEKKEKYDEEKDDEESDDDEEEDDEEDDKEDMNEQAPKGMKYEYSKVVDQLGKNQKGKIEAKKAFKEIEDGGDKEEAIKKMKNQDAKNLMRKVLLGKGQYEA